jgi:hypothetical protein
MGLPAAPDNTNPKQEWYPSLGKALKAVRMGNGRRGKLLGANGGRLTRMAT